MISLVQHNWLYFHCKFAQFFFSTLYVCCSPPKRDTWWVFLISYSPVHHKKAITYGEAIKTITRKKISTSHNTESAQTNAWRWWCLSMRYECFAILASPLISHRHFKCFLCMSNDVWVVCGLTLWSLGPMNRHATKSNLKILFHILLEFFVIFY